MKISAVYQGIGFALEKSNSKTKRFEGLAVYSANDFNYHNQESGLLECA